MWRAASPRWGSPAHHRGLAVARHHAGVPGHRHLLAGALDLAAAGARNDALSTRLRGWACTARPRRIKRFFPRRAMSPPFSWLAHSRRPLASVHGKERGLHDIMLNFLVFIVAEPQDGGRADAFDHQAGRGCKKRYRR